MNDDDAERYANVAFAIVMRIIIYALFGIFIVIIWLFRAYPQVMRALLGVLLVFLLLSGAVAGVFAILSPGAHIGQSGSSTGGTDPGSRQNKAVVTATTAGTNSVVTKNSTLPQSSDWRLRLYNVDDHTMAGLNGTIIAEAAYGEDSGWIDITSKMIPGDNILYLGAWNDGGGYTWGLSVQYSGETVWDNHAGKQGNDGANNDDRTKPHQTVFGQVLVLHANGTVSQSDNSVGTDSGSSRLSVGATARVTSLGLAVHSQPGIDKATEIGVAKQGTTMHVIGGPVVLPTTSDSDQPMLRNWWLVTGWDSGGTAGWSSGRYLELVP